jgi:hypothetical protein
MSVLQEFNSIYPNLKFTLETESQNKLNYLDININKHHNKVAFEIYEIYTTTDTIIRDSSCHPN